MPKRTPMKQSRRCLKPAMVWARKSPRTRGSIGLRQKSNGRATIALPFLICTGCFGSAAAAGVDQPPDQVEPEGRPLSNRDHRDSASEDFAYQQAQTVWTVTGEQQPQIACAVTFCRDWRLNRRDNG